jgi:hypothetical protein
VLGGVDGSLHLKVPSTNRLNQTEPATFSILLCLAFFRDSYFSILTEMVWADSCLFFSDSNIVSFLAEEADLQYKLDFSFKFIA